MASTRLKLCFFPVLRLYIPNNVSVKRNIVRTVCALVLTGTFWYC